MWIGLERHKKSCYADLPENFTLPETIGQNLIPTYLVTNEKHVKKTL